MTKTFVSVKGVYHETSLHGATVRWLVPHQYTQKDDDDVDLKVSTRALAGEGSARNERLPPGCTTEAATTKSVPSGAEIFLRGP